MAGYVVIRITERLGGGEPLRTAYAVAEPNQHRAIALFKLRPDHTADEQVEAVVELSQSALDSLGLKPGMIKPPFDGPSVLGKLRRLRRRGQCEAMEGAQRDQ
jgi:hypothetical protein